VAALDPRRAALIELDGLLALARSSPLGRDACQRLIELAPTVPGRTRQIVEALGRQCDAAAVDALLELPSATPGVIEALFGALRRGVVRQAVDGHEFPHMLALEFRSSKSRRFVSLLERAAAAFGSELERIRIDTRLHYRFALIEAGGEALNTASPGGPRALGGGEALNAASLRERAAPVELDVEQLHRDLTRLRGVRLWLNGWCFDDRSNVAPRTRTPLLHAWFEWVHTIQPRTNTAIDST
jgi:hypothetical protein